MRNLFAIGTLVLLGVAGSALVSAQAATPSEFYAAIVNSAGGLIDNVGVDGVTRTDEGRYTVRFKKDVDECFPTATIYGGTSGAIRVFRDAGDPKEINITTRSEGTATVTATFADRSFSLVVICK